MRSLSTETDSSGISPAVQNWEHINDAADPPVRGFLHRARGGSAGLVLTHGAGGNCNSPLLVALAEELCQHGWHVLRCDLPFRQARPHGPPLRSSDRDQLGLQRASEILRNVAAGRVLLGGHSYGGRMASMLAAKEPSVSDGLLLLSYPLHPPEKPEQLRTAHFPQVRTPCLLVHGTRDPFATSEEIDKAITLMEGETAILEIEGAGHELVSKKKTDLGTLDCAAIAARIREKVLEIWKD